MISRRQFVGALAGLTAVTALAGAGLRLPKRTEVPFDANPYLTSRDAWYLKDWPGPYLSEASLQKMIEQLRENHSAYGPLRILPRKLIVPPHLAERAQAIITAPPPSLFERAIWWLFPEPV